MKNDVRASGIGSIIRHRQALRRALDDHRIDNGAAATPTAVFA